ncbi:MAG: LicD family protein [Eubacterium sp.]|nr:LicD family protein [Eubacterium sp.]
MFYKEYDEATLNRIRAIEMEIFHDFQDLCSKHKIDYFAGGGTAIGAVRHHGMIPWDDDIDVNLLRKDYERFLKYAREEYSDKYEIVNAETRENYPLMSTRWCKKGTRFKEESLRNLDIEFGIFLDVYCFDNVPDNDILMKKQGWMVWILNKLMILKAVEKPVLYFEGWKAKLTYFICGFVHKVLNILPVSNQMLYRFVKRELTKYNRRKTKRVSYYFDPTPFTSVIKIKDIKPTREVAFEEGSIKVGCHVENYLKRRFGDYMKLPPEEKRHNHPPYILDFGDEQ